MANSVNIIFMVSLAERESRAPEGVKEIPETPEVPESVEKGGVSARQTQVKTHVKQGGKPLTQTQASKQVTIQIPADQGILAAWAKGPVTSSLTWFGVFWLRMIKKAAHFGWKIIKKSNNKSQT